MITRMPGEGPAKFAHLRALYAFMWCHPGKKLLFMGQEFAQGREWNHDCGLDWEQLDHPLHRGAQCLIRDLNRLYRENPALHNSDADPQGFLWLDADDAAHSIYAFLRQGGGKRLAVVANLTPVARRGYRLGLPGSGTWREVLNTDASLYGGANGGNFGHVQAGPVPAQSQGFSAEIYLPPLSVLVFEEA